jgi:hypothetical protein
MARNSEMPTPEGPSAGVNTAVVLCHADRELVLLPGKYLIGRSRSCHLVVNDDLVSRRHAELEVGLDGRVMLRNLSSHNGITVNQQQIASQLTALSSGDTFVIGAETFQIFLSGDALESATMKVVEVVTDAASTVVKRSSNSVTDATRATHDLDLVAAVADCAIADGRFGEAEKILAKHLRGVLADIRGLRQTGTEVRDKAYKYSLRLAEVTRKPEWFDLAVDLLFVQGIVCSGPQVEELLRVRKLLGKLDPHRLEQYAELVRYKGDTVQNRRIASLLDTIVNYGKSG